jgi:hypothetical protein
MTDPAARPPLDLPAALGLALAVALLLGLLGWPVPLAPTTTALGGAQGDFASIAWGLWRVGEALPGLPAVKVEGLLWPDGARLLVADLPGSLLVAPFARLFGPVFAYNLLQLAHPALAAALTLLALRAEGRSRLAAAAGGLTFGLSPVLLSGLHNGNPDVTPVFFIPLVVLLARRAQGGAAPAAALGLGLGLSAWCNPYVALMCGVAALCWLPWPHDRRAAGRLLITGLVAGLVAVALLWPYLSLVESTINGPDAMVRKRGPHHVSAGAAWLRGFFWPDQDEIQDGWTRHAWYLGLAPLALALWGLLRPPPRAPQGAAPQGDPAPRWLLLTGLGLLLALGGALRWGPTDLTVAGQTLWLPWHWMQRLQSLDALAIAYRFASLAALGVGALAARGLDARDLKDMPRGRPLAVGLILLDLLAFGPGAAFVRSGRVEVDASCRLLTGLEAGAVFDLPATLDERWLLNQTCHGRPVAAGINSPFPRRLTPLVLGDVAALPAGLRGAGYRWLVIHPLEPTEKIDQKLIAELPRRWPEAVQIQEAGVIILDLTVIPPPAGMVAPTDRPPPPPPPPPERGEP